MEPSDGLGTIWGGIAGSIATTGDMVSRVSGLGHRSLAFTFTAITGGGQTSAFSGSRIKTSSTSELTSGTTIA